MEIALRSDEDEICRAAEAVESLCPTAGFSRQRCEDVRVAVLEALSNAMTHAHGSRSEVPILVRAAVAGTSLLVEIRDHGSGPPLIPPEPNLAKKLTGAETPRGWGIHLMRMLASEVEFRVDHRGHTVRLRFEAARPAALAPASIRSEPAV
ncbi:MAG TPA: ATP-binding protein [bacterium]|nr:ATP-binding protein [bacterium]